MTVALADTLLKLIWQDGYSLGESVILHKGTLCTHIDASKDGERWSVIAPNRYTAAVELMDQLGWDFEDG